MATSKKRRAIPKAYATGPAERAATAQDRFYRDLEGAPAYQVIRDRETGEVFERRTVTRTECYHEVAQLNAGVELSPISQSILLKRGRRVKSNDPTQLSATEWVEWLMSHPATVEDLQNYKPIGSRALSSDNLHAMMQNAAPGIDFDEGILAAVMQQLYRKFGIGHKR